MLSILELFKIGVGPSSSHTLGPMRAAKIFMDELKTTDFQALSQVQVEIYGSLAFTGEGHGTSAAILAGLCGYEAKTIIAATLMNMVDNIKTTPYLTLKHQGQTKTIPFIFAQDFIFNLHSLLPEHSNGMRFCATLAHGEKIEKYFYSIGGGFILPNDKNKAAPSFFPYSFASAKELLNLCLKHELRICDLVRANEAMYRGDIQTKQALDEIIATMQETIERGCKAQGYLPGPLQVKRRANPIFNHIKNNTDKQSHAWLNLYAIAVNEENACFGRIVTAPTNGAAGIIPAVLFYYLNFNPKAKMEDAYEFLFTAGAIGLLYKKGASISGAEVGCQGEVGVACSMAAAGLTAVLGGTPLQIENAAEIAMEHNLGLTCDPIGGLVQIPCIERNAMGALKALNASQLALLGDGEHYVSLDKVIATMKQTGKDMLAIYKETSLGGLAANLPEC